MNLVESFRIALRALGANKARSALTMLGVIIGVAAAVGCGGSSYGTNPSPNPATPVPSSGGTTADVTITVNGIDGGMSFSPSPGGVTVGQTVAWKNADSIAHTATGSGFNAGAIAGGATSAPIKFSTAGTINYACSFHPSMVGTLNVAQ